MMISEHECHILRRAILDGMLAETNRIRNQLEAALKDADFLTLDYDWFEMEFTRRVKDVQRCRELDEERAK